MRENPWNLIAMIPPRLFSKSEIEKGSVKLTSNLLSYPTILFISIIFVIAGFIWFIIFVMKKILIRFRMNLK